MDPIERQEAINAPTIEPERKVEELLPDGTLHLFTDTDLSKVDRILLSQKGTRYGDLYYADGEPKIGKWIKTYRNGFGSLIGYCNQCGRSASVDNFCPNCGARMEK